MAYWLVVSTHLKNIKIGYVSLNRGEQINIFETTTKVSDVFPENEGLALQTRVSDNEPEPKKHHSHLTNEVPW